MDSRTGRRIRRARLLNPESGRAVIVAFSHGILLGPVAGIQTLEQMRRVAIEDLRAAEAVLVSPGLVEPLEEAFLGRDRPSLLIHYDWQSYSRKVLGRHGGSATSLATIEEVAAAGADGVMTYLYVGGDAEAERREIERNARTARECEGWGLVCIIEPRSAEEKSSPDHKKDPEVLAYYCRVAAEIGADFVKCIYPGSPDAFARVVEQCPAPVVMAGGARLEDPRQALEQARVAVAAGAKGIMFGRNIWQAPSPRRMLDAMRAVVHHGATVEEALQILKGV